MNKMQEFFDRWAKNYDDYLPKLPQYRELVRTIVSNVAVDSNSEVLDVGVGTPPKQFHVHANRSNEESITFWKASGDITKIINDIRKIVRCEKMKLFLIHVPAFDQKYEVKLE